MSEPKKNKRGAEPVIIRREVSQWISKNSSIGQVNNWKVGGGRPSYNGTK